jgi:hypothetical protein
MSALDRQMGLMNVFLCLTLSACLCLALPIHWQRQFICLCSIFFSFFFVQNFLLCQMPETLTLSTSRQYHTDIATPKGKLFHSFELFIQIRLLS